MSQNLSSYTVILRQEAFFTGNDRDSLWHFVVNGNNVAVAVENAFQALMSDLEIASSDSAAFRAVTDAVYVFTGEHQPLDTPAAGYVDQLALV